jgi:hypothetical protein
MTGETAPAFYAEASALGINVTGPTAVVRIVEFAVRPVESLPATTRTIVVEDITVVARVDSVVLTGLPRTTLHFVAFTIAHSVCCRVGREESA